MTNETKKARNKNLGQQILTTLEGGDFTADEIANLLGVDIKLVRPRISEMKAKGLITTTGAKRAGTVGRSPSVLTKVRVIQA